jgi:hypothetical protein
VNKDDMNDDAQFDAFLRGEGDLTRDLQGLAQPGPSASLDAAILANARQAMAQEPRSDAANDSGAAPSAPRLAPGLGWRWRAPAGIAAAVLVGVFAQQTFNTSGDLNDVSTPSAPAAEVAAEHPAPAPIMTVPEAKPAAPAESRAAAAPVNKPATPKAQRNEPTPTVSADNATVEPAMDESVSELKQPSPAPAAAPAPPVRHEPQAVARSRMADAAASEAREKAAPSAQERLDRIEKLLADGMTAQAMAEWKAFRVAHPDYPVRDATRARLE